MNVWYDVKTGSLPPENQRVLGTDGEKHEVVYRQKEKGNWVGCTSTYGYLMIIKKVTHWMPLPELQKKQ